MLTAGIATGTDDEVKYFREWADQIDGAALSASVPEALRGVGQGQTDRLRDGLPER